MSFILCIITVSKVFKSSFTGAPFDRMGQFLKLVCFGSNMAVIFYLIEGNFEIQAINVLFCSTDIVMRPLPPVVGLKFYAIAEAAI
jgi:hypothetical protein